MNAAKTLSIDSEPTNIEEVDRGTPSVLVVDDSSLFRRMAGGLIRDGIGCRVAYANDGIEALSLLESVEPSVVLTDIQMPRMDGVAATRAIRQLSGIRQPRIVALTANAMDSDRQACLNAGMEDFLSKPFQVSDLQDRLETAASLVKG